MIEQGPNTQNPYIIAYGEEGQSAPLPIADNTVVNTTIPAASAWPRLNPTSTPLNFTDNSVYVWIDRCPAIQWALGRVSVVSDDKGRLAEHDICLEQDIRIRGSLFSGGHEDRRVGGEGLRSWQLVMRSGQSTATAIPDLVVTLDGQLSAQPVRLGRPTAHLI